ncbi:MAG: zinc ribbon domain-containing protein [Candidatus Aenigmarchaeota archaeon]|nr:zinc ribbon domain-containing protein [Candidatus Aenigmarchaeota archaeon]
MECPSCLADISEEWQYCPRCGSPAKRKDFGVDNAFSRFKKEFGEFDRFFEKNFGMVNITPEASIKPISRGFSIRIVTRPGTAPKVSIQTYGDVDANTIRKRVEDSMGVRGEARKAEQANQPTPAGHQKRGQPKGGYQTDGQPRIKQEDLPSEEPEANVSNLGGRLVVEIPLPSVESQKDIDIKELESSIEVKAIAKDKVYFKILTKPEGFRLRSGRLDNGKLILELS